MKYVIVMIAVLILLAGCNSLKSDVSNVEPVTAPVAKPADRGGAASIAQEASKEPETKDLNHVVNGKIDCESINSNPKLIYLKSGNSIGYNSHIKSKELSLSGYSLREERNDSILIGGEYCSFGTELRQNENYLYCRHTSYAIKKVAADGAITRLGFIIIQPTFYVDKSKDMPDTNGQFNLVEDAKLISQECKVTSTGLK